jgi:preprotein translocase subunit SecA
MHLLAPQLDGDQGGDQGDGSARHPASGRLNPSTGNRALEPDESAPSIQLTPQRREAPKVGRNDPCPCGSGKKYKSCHGRDA